jgi:atypical protein kinase C zeta type
MLAKLPPQLSSYRFLSIGAVGFVYQIDSCVVLKFPRDQNDECFSREVEIFDLFEKHSPCPDIVQSFLRVPQGNFLAYLSGGTLEQRLRGNQKGKEHLSAIERWAMELSNATAWLESLGYIHGDIRPPNILFDGHDHLKLTDFDSVAEIGTRYDGAAPPWARLLGLEAGDENGTFGRCGAKTEQFAIGSIIYFATRGYEPYEMEDLGEDHGPRVVELLQKMKFPDLSGGRLDQIIEQCWNGQFATLKELARETSLLPGANGLPRATPLDKVYCEEIRRKCQRLVEDGLLTTV